ncbi:MAG: DUF4998 domain-containing protein [Bacteroidales bacterium]|nr:DUF4998 domain-containing protein [Bacteroidales bacterium]
MKIYLYITIIYSIVFFASCSNMNDMHDPYMKKGETNYIGKIDSLYAYSGYDKVKLIYWITDPRAVTTTIYWNDKEDSVVVNIPKHAPSDTLFTLLDPIPESDYTFKFINRDDQGDRSIYYEKFINVYGKFFSSTLTNRVVKSAALNSSDELVVTFGGSNDSKEIGIEIEYMDLDGNSANLFIASEDLIANMVIPNFDKNYDAFYSTCYKPYLEAIDVFKADKAQLYTVSE